MADFGQHDTPRVVRALIADLGSPQAALRYIDTFLSAEGQAAFALARRALEQMVA